MDLCYLHDLLMAFEKEADFYGNEITPIGMLYSLICDIIKKIILLKERE